MAQYHEFRSDNYMDLIKTIYIFFKSSVPPLITKLQRVLINKKINRQII